ncbi:MaoC family dehydratase [Ferrovibrio sp. MS7]|jgi:acyl dehydratase|uniref:MaoC family dehydratase n=1 Tax=Ferrovibrio plantarum TaxID=3119164 RepID=UPI003134C993
MVDAEPSYIGLGFFLEDWTFGRCFRTIGRSITDADITNFVNATGMVEVLFTDLDYVARASSFKARPAPGIMVYAFAEGLQMQAALQHTGIAYLGGEIAVKAPCLAGDTIHVVVTVSDTRPTSKPGRGIVTTHNAVINQRGETVLEYTAKRMVKSRMPQQEAAKGANAG